jgi:hypothetical protein
VGEDCELGHRIIGTELDKLREVPTITEAQLAVDRHGLASTETRRDADERVVRLLLEEARREAERIRRGASKEA